MNTPRVLANWKIKVWSVEKSPDLLLDFPVYH